MLVESLVKSMLALQGIRVANVTGGASGLVVTVEPGRRSSPRWGQCLAPGAYRDTRAMQRFHHVPLWRIAVERRYAPRRVSCSRCQGIHLEAMPWVSAK